MTGVSTTTAATAPDEKTSLATSSTQAQPRESPPQYSDVFELLGPPRRRAVGSATDVAPLSTQPSENKKPLEDHLPSTIREKLARGGGGGGVGGSVGDEGRGSLSGGEVGVVGSGTSASGDGDEPYEIDFERVVDVVARHAQEQQHGPNDDVGSSPTKVKDIQLLATAIQENIVVQVDAKASKKSKENVPTPASNISDVGLLLAAVGY